MSSDNSNYATKKDLEDLKKMMDKRFEEAPKKEKEKEKVTRAPNTYNLYMKDKIAEMKKTDPALTNKEAFKKGAESWNLQKLEKTKEFNKDIKK